MNLAQEKRMQSLEMREHPTQGLTLSVVLPVLNEESGIREIVDRIQAATLRLVEAGVTRTEIIVVDDGSTDRTCEIVSSLPGVRLVRHGSNFGYGAAIKTGFAKAEGDLLAFLDADGTYPPEHFPQLCKAAIDEDADIVVGSRRSGGETSMPRLRRLGNFIWSNLVSILGESRCCDPASGMRILRPSCLPSLYPLPDGLNFTPVMSIRTLHEQLKVIELPIPYAERVGRSKLSVVRDGLRFLKTILWTVLEYNPAKILGMTGVALLLFAGMLGTGLLLARISGVTSLSVFGVLVAYLTLVAAVLGLSVYGVGVTSSFIVSRVNGQSRKIGLFKGFPIERWLEPHLGSLGAVSVCIGICLALTGVLSHGPAWDLNRIWLWLLGGAMFTLAGVQMWLLWLVDRVVDTLYARESMVKCDMGQAAAEAPRARAIGAAAGTR